MAEEIATEEDAPKKKGGKLGIIIGLVLAVAGGGGAFYAVQTGIVLGPKEEHAAIENVEEAPLVAFVPIDPMIIPMGKQSRYQLRFNAQLEVAPNQAEQVSHVMPRILDVLNGYLRAVDVEELADPSSLLKLRAQMLRRVQLVTGRDQVKDLLITEFVFG